VSFRPVEILLVEDSAGDARLMQEAFKGLSSPTKLHVVRDGVEAMSFLRREGAHGQAPRPQLVLLDLNLPRRDGREVLALIKADPQLKDIPVVVLSTSASPEDVRHCYGLHANSYLTKPADLDEFFQVVDTIERYWLKTARLPGR